MFKFPHSVTPTGADHRERDDVRSGGTLCFDVSIRRIEIETEWTTRSHEERKRDSVQLQNCPTQAKTGLEWGTPYPSLPKQAMSDRACELFRQFADVGRHIPGKAVER
jgi:hypothetical protein